MLLFLTKPMDDDPQKSQYLLQHLGCPFLTAFPIWQSPIPEVELFVLQRFLIRLWSSSLEEVLGSSSLAGYIQGWLKCFAAFITNPVTEDENWEIYLSSNDSLLPGELGDLGWVPWLIYVYFLIQSRDSNGFHLTRLLWGISNTVHIFSRMFNT